MRRFTKFAAMGALLLTCTGCDLDFLDANEDGQITIAEIQSFFCGEEEPTGEEPSGEQPGPTRPMPQDPTTDGPDPQ
jgi:hypothetical protein